MAPSSGLRMENCTVDVVTAAAVAASGIAAASYDTIVMSAATVDVVLLVVPLTLRNAISSYTKSGQLL